MTREEQREQASIAFTEANCPRAIGGDYFRDLVNPFNINHDFIAGAQWADKTMLQEVLEWLENGTTDTSDEYANPMVAFITFDYKKQMIQAFKERFSLS